MTTTPPTGTSRAALHRLPPLPGEVISWPTTRAVPAMQGTLALDLDGDAVADSVADAVAGARPPTLRVVPDADDSGVTTSATRAMRARAARFAMAVVEVVGGDRPVSQLLAGSPLTSTTRWPSSRAP